MLKIVGSGFDPRNHPFPFESDWAGSFSLKHGEVHESPWLASAASLIAIVTGFAALLTLATSAAARYEPSLQFLQLLSSLDIAWVTAALFYGAWKLWGRLPAWILGSLIVVACVGSIAVYLNVVGFTESGGWLVDAPRMMTIVIPADMVAAVVALSVLLSAGLKTDQATVQRSPQ